MTDHPPPPLTNPSLADELLVVRCQLGERAAFDALIARWHQALWRYARNLTGQDAAADDATQEVWLRVLRGIARLRDGARLRSWLFGIAHKVLMDRLREQYARAPAIDLDPELLAASESGEVQEQAQDHEHDLAHMREQLARLPLVENEILTLFYLRELSIDDIAQTLAIPAGTVKSRLFRARKLLRHTMSTALKGVPS